MPVLYTVMQEAINHIAAACAAADVRYAIICPGSRNAPLTMAFVRHPDIECHSVVDERSAAFIALGMAQQVQHPVALICTSGSAVVNFYPAIVEAFYQRIPLLIITADRPPELIDKWDGQTMHQHGVFGKHVKASYTLPNQYNNHEEFSTTVFEAYTVATTGNNGPVHLNVPLREPLYTAIYDTFSYPAVAYKKPVNTPLPQKHNELLTAFKNAEKVLVFNGADKANNDINLVHDTIGEKAVIISDVVSNRKGNIQYWDLLLSKKNADIPHQLRPDVLITTGTSTVSKNLKLFLRQNKPTHHFHISPTGDIADPFQTNPQIVTGNIAEVLSSLPWAEKTNKYRQQWYAWDKTLMQLATDTLNTTTFCEFTAVKKITEQLPANSQLQLANSMAVRWLNLLGYRSAQGSVHCNRGVSGIDGCSSTAVGAALIAKSSPVTLITGDVAFFYDSNALWNKFAPANLRIIILNNGGGAIFRLIDGPGQMPEREEFLETRHQRTAKLLCEDMKVGYAQASNFEELERELELLYQVSDRPKVLEVFTDAETNTKFFNEYKQLIHGLE